MLLEDALRVAVDVLPERVAVDVLPERVAVEDELVRVGAVAVVVPRLTVVWEPEGETVVVRVLELPEVLTRLLTVVDGALVTVVEPLRDAAEEVGVEAVLDVDVDVEDVDVEVDVEAEPLREADVDVPDVLEAEVEPLRDAVVDVPEEVEAVVELLRVAGAVVAERVVVVAEDERAAVVVEVFVTVDSAWSERTSLALAADLVTVADDEALAMVAVRTGRPELRTLNARSGYCFS